MVNFQAALSAADSEIEQLWYAQHCQPTIPVDRFFTSTQETIADCQRYLCWPSDAEGFFLTKNILSFED
jgi:hypothetical protein